MMNRSKKKSRTKLKPPEIRWKWQDSLTKPIDTLKTENLTKSLDTLKIESLAWLPLGNGCKTGSLFPSHVLSETHWSGCKCKLCSLWESTWLEKLLLTLAVVSGKVLYLGLVAETTNKSFPWSRVSWSMAECACYFWLRDILILWTPSWVFSTWIF